MLNNMDLAKSTVKYCEENKNSQYLLLQSSIKALEQTIAEFSKTNFCLPI
uniref:Uncharacterized protein n=1 Tax=Strigamia maritima TaxID=126957 RepID=T1ILB9_STRMM